MSTGTRAVSPVLGLKTAGILACIAVKTQEEDSHASLKQAKNELGGVVMGKDAACSGGWRAGPQGGGGLLHPS